MEDTSLYYNLETEIFDRKKYFKWLDGRWKVDEVKTKEMDLLNYLKKNAGAKSSKEKLRKAYPLQIAEGETPSNLQSFADQINNAVLSLEIKSDNSDSDVVMHNNAVELIKEKITKIIERFIPLDKDSDFVEAQYKDYFEEEKRKYRQLESECNAWRAEVGKLTEELRIRRGQDIANARTGALQSVNEACQCQWCVNARQARTQQIPPTGTSPQWRTFNGFGVAPTNDSIPLTSTLPGAVLNVEALEAAVDAIIGNN